MNNNYAVIVVGAGTAGTYFAKRLAEQGYRVLVVEKAPKEKLGSRLDIFHIDKELFEKFGVPAPSATDELGDSACITKPCSGEGITAAWGLCAIAADEFARAMRDGRYPGAKSVWNTNGRYQRGQGAKFAYIMATLIGAVHSTAAENDYQFKKDIVFNEKGYDSHEPGFRREPGSRQHHFPGFQNSRRGFNEKHLHGHSPGPASFRDAGGKLRNTMKTTLKISQHMKHGSKKRNNCGPPLVPWRIRKNVDHLREVMS